MPPSATSTPPTPLSLLENPTTANLTHLFTQFSTYLNQTPHPLYKYITTNTKPPSSDLRPLAKKYYEFISKSLSLLPKLLTEKTQNPKTQTLTQNNLSQLFQSYNLCLDCLDLISPELGGKPYAIHLQRARYLHCLIKWEMYEDGVEVGKSVLRKLGDGKTVVPKEGERVEFESDFVRLVVDLVVSVVQCVVLSKSKDEGRYMLLLGLVKDVRPWFRHLDASTCSKLRLKLLAYLKNVTMYMVREAKIFGGDLVSKVFEATLDEYVQMLKDPSLQGRIVEELKEFVKFISNCTYKYRTVCKEVPVAMATHLYSSAGELSEDQAYISVILRLYATGLHLAVCNFQSYCTPNDRSWPEGCKKLHDLSALLESGKKYYPSKLDECDKPRKGKCLVEKGSVCSGRLNNFDGDEFLSFYLNALKFACRPLADYVNSERKKIFGEAMEPLYRIGVQNIQELFLKFSNIFPHLQTVNDPGGEVDTVLLNISVASFTLDLKFSTSVKESEGLIHYLLSDKSIHPLQPSRLKYIIGMLHNMFVELYRNERVEQASKAVILCSRASWNYCGLLCEILAGKRNESDEEVAETMITDSLKEACIVSTSLMDILHQVDSTKLQKEVVFCLEKWCLARRLFRKLPIPVTLVKHWVKMQCKLHKNLEVVGPILGSDLLASPCLKKHDVSSETVVIILEQEVIAYEEIGKLSKFSQRMHMVIIDILFETLDNPYQKSKILIKKGKLYRASGIRGLENCISCINGAIKVIKDNVSDPSGQLAVLFCLHALCIQEANPSSEEICQNIREAVELWKASDVPDNSSPEENDLGCEYVLQLLYHIADLLSLKGEVALHLNVVKLLIKAFKRMEFSVEKCLSLLWGCRRLSHGLCFLPVNKTFIMALDEHYGKEVQSLEFWINSFKDFPPLSVGFQQNFSFLWSVFPLAFHQCKHPMQTDISVDEVKEVASHLISEASVSHRSAFLAGYLYHDLSERLCAGGNMIEALACAREAHRLRGKLLQEHFSCSFQQSEDQHDESGETIPNSSPFVRRFVVSNQAAICAWEKNAIARDSDGFVLTPWNVLQCYLQSTLQVGILHERLGNGVEAEAQFILGKSISSGQSLSLFITIFSSCLGGLYLGKGFLELAQIELGTAKERLVGTEEQRLDCEREKISCSRCLLMLESIVLEKLGELYGREVHDATGNPYEKSLRSLMSLKSGDVSVWLEEANSAHSMPQKEFANVSKISCRTTEDFSAKGKLSTNNTAKTKMDSRRSRKTKNDPDSLATGASGAIKQTSRVTRSTKQSIQSNKVDSKCFLESKGTSDFNKVNCWKCYSDEVGNFGLLISLVQVKWEIVRRQQLLRLLIGLGKCKRTSGIDEVHNIYSKCISVLAGGNDCHCLHLTSAELDVAGAGRIWAGELAEVLYNVCWLFLRASCSDNLRSTDCVVCCLQAPQMLSLLKLSFVLSREIPVLFHKVSTLLSLVYVILAGGTNSSISVPPCKELSENYWAAYFHQASIGAHHNLRIIVSDMVKHQSQKEDKVKVSEAADPNRLSSTIGSLFRRIMPASTDDMEAHVAYFFENLPTFTIVCMSLLDSSYSSLLGLQCSSSGQGWLLLSHLNGDNQPAVVLLPLGSVLRENPVEETSMNSIFGSDNGHKEWHSPWGCSTAVDEVAPLFKMILQGNYRSCSSFPEEDTEIDRETWWRRRVNLDSCLRKLLRDMEESWVGLWKLLLLGQWSDSEPLNSAVKGLVHEIKVRYKSDVKESILRIILGGIKSSNLEKEQIPWKFLKMGCHVGEIRKCDQELPSSLDEVCDGADFISGPLVRSMLAAVDKLEAEYCTRREPVVLVLENNVQMIPWENIPILREQEVYRMPSVASISVALQKRSLLEKVVRPVRFPLIDPLDAFYLLNPSGDLSRTQSEFEEWFRLQNMQGKAGIVPSAEELTAALKDHDLFLYFGHGSGAQYISPDKIQKIDECAASLLMGCSSGCLNLNGNYAPLGTSLSYVLAGSPVVVANLWEVTDLDIDRFGKALLKSFMDERSMSSMGCIQCSMLAEELNSLSVNEKPGKTKRGRGKKKPVETVPDVCEGYCYRHKLRAAYFVSQARKACKLPYLIGAAPVCYGVPTGIRKKDDTQC